MKTLNLQKDGDKKSEDGNSLCTHILIFNKQPLHEVEFYRENVDTPMIIQKQMAELNNRSKNPDYFTMVSGVKIILHRNLVDEFKSHPVRVVQYKRKIGFVLATRVVKIYDEVKIKATSQPEGLVQVFINNIERESLRYCTEGNLRLNQIDARLRSMDKPFGFVKPEKQEAYIHMYVNLCFEISGYEKPYKGKTFKK